MSKIRVSEIFASIQGEGRFAGVPSVFLRTWNCNFTCPGFGMPHGEKTDQPADVAKIVLQDTAKYKEIKDLPLVAKGCDSYISWLPELKHFSPLMTVDEIVSKIKDLLPNGKFSRDYHLVLTGGEPLLGWGKAYPALFTKLKCGLGLTNVTIETNGTQQLVDELKMYLASSGLMIHFSVSPKLSCSGESWEDAIKPNAVAKYAHYGIVDLKFVVDSKQHLPEVLEAVKEYKDYGCQFSSVYLMPQGGLNAEYQSNARTVADMAVANGFRYSPRLQNDLYGNEWAT